MPRDWPEARADLARRGFASIIPQIEAEMAATGQDWRPVVHAYVQQLREHAYRRDRQRMHVYVARSVIKAEIARRGAVASP